LIILQYICKDFPGN